jgi:hypothetical protein
MKSLIILPSVLLLAGAVSDGQTPKAAPDSSRGVFLERHIDAHVPAQQGQPAASPTDERNSSRSAPDPALGTSAVRPPDPMPPAIQYQRDPLFRDRRP